MCLSLEVFHSLSRTAVVHRLKQKYVFWSAETRLYKFHVLGVVLRTERSLYRTLTDNYVVE